MAIKPLTIGSATVLGVGCVLHIVGLATHAWLTADDGSLGFWEVCTKGLCISIDEDGKPGKNLGLQEELIVERGGGEVVFFDKCLPFLRHLL